MRCLTSGLFEDANGSRVTLLHSAQARLHHLVSFHEVQRTFGPMMATVMRAGGDNVTEGIVPDSGHWIMEENPRATIQLVRDFLTR